MSTYGCCGEYNEHSKDCVTVQLTTKTSRVAKLTNLVESKDRVISALEQKLLTQSERVAHLDAACVQHIRVGDILSAENARLHEALAKFFEYFRCDGETKAKADAKELAFNEFTEMAEALQSRQVTNSGGVEGHASVAQNDGGNNIRKSGSASTDVEQVSSPAPSQTTQQSYTCMDCVRRDQECPHGAPFAPDPFFDPEGHEKVFLHGSGGDDEYIIPASVLGAEKDRRVLIAVAAAIDWDQQYASQFYIGEDAAEAALVRLGFDFNEGQCNEAVEKFLKTLQPEKDSHDD